MALNQDTAPVLFDRALLRRRLDRARRVGPAAFLLDRVAEDMGDRLQTVTREFLDAADIWTPGPALDAVLGSRCKSIRHVDLGHSETLPFEAQSLDLAVSALAFQFVNDLPGVLAQIRRALRPDGLLLAAMIGGDTIDRAQQPCRGEAEWEGGVSPRARPFADLRDIGALLQRAGFALPVTDVDQLVVRYDEHCADAGSAAHGCHQHPLRAAADADRRATMLRTAQLRRALPSGPPHPRHLRCDLAVRLGRMRAAGSRRRAGSANQPEAAVRGAKRADRGLQPCHCDERGCTHDRRSQQQIHQMRISGMSAAGIG